MDKLRTSDYPNLPMQKHKRRVQYETEKRHTTRKYQTQKTTINRRDQWATGADFFETYGKSEKWEGCAHVIQDNHTFCYLSWQMAVISRQRLLIGLDDLCVVLFV